MTKMTITEQINAIAFDTLTEEQFNFLVERALKSVRKSNGERKPTKVQKASALLKQMVDSGEVVKAKDGKATIFTVA